MGCTSGKYRNLFKNHHVIPLNLNYVAGSHLDNLLSGDIKMQYIKIAVVGPFPPLIGGTAAFLKVFVLDIKELG